MARGPRVVVPGCPHHITDRGNRGEPIFLEPGHRTVYRWWLRHYAKAHGVHLWAYCLMTNHVHLIAVPEREDSFALGIGYAHRRYAQWLNARQEWSGHLWGDRFRSIPMDTLHLWRATKYVETNPVRAGLVAAAEEYRWSSARAHGLGHFDALLDRNRPFPDPQAVGDWAAWLAGGLDEEVADRIRRHTAGGWPLGSEEFVRALELEAGRPLTPPRRGRPKKR